MMNKTDIKITNSTEARLIGLIYLLSLLFSIQSITSIQSTSFSLPIIQLFYDAAGPHLAILLTVVVLIAQAAAAITAWTASSRLFFALARDRAFPFKAIFMAQNRFDVPYAGLILSVVVGCALCACYIGSPIAFNAILSSAAISVLLAYGMPVLCRALWPRGLDGLKGPFRLGRFSWAINLASLLFVILMSVLFIMPTSYPATAQNMNYAVVAIGGLIAIVTVQWVSWGMHVYDGVVHTYGGDSSPGAIEVKELEGWDLSNGRTTFDVKGNVGTETR